VNPSRSAGLSETSYSKFTKLSQGSVDRTSGDIRTMDAKTRHCQGLPLPHTIPVTFSV
jgi:hypothetical protein